MKWRVQGTARRLVSFEVIVAASDAVMAAGYVAEAIPGAAINFIEKVGF